MSKRLAIKVAVSGLVTALALVSADRPASAKDVIRCQAKGQPDVIMTLDGERKFGRVLSCIKGDFVADMTPCAPNGGYGLSYPTGSASLAKVVDRWQDYADHLGGIAGYAADASSLQFDSDFYSRPQETRCLGQPLGLQGRPSDGKGYADPGGETGHRVYMREGEASFLGRSRSGPMATFRLAPTERKALRQIALDQDTTAQALADEEAIHNVLRQHKY